VSILDKLETLAKKMKNGSATIEEVNEFRFLSCQQMIVSLQVGGTKDLLALDKGQLIPVLDAMGVLMFPDEWKWEPNLVAITAETTNEEEEKQQ
jgi:hypothetical protein